MSNTPQAATPPKTFKFSHPIAGSTFICSKGRSYTFVPQGEGKTGGVLTTQDADLAKQLSDASQRNPQISVL